jgi:Protein of unknown function (DUF2637)
LRALAGIATAISYSHMRELAAAHGEAGWHAHTIPLSVGRHRDLRVPGIAGLPVHRPPLGLVALGSAGRLNDGEDDRERRPSRHGPDRPGHRELAHGLRHHGCLATRLPADQGRHPPSAKPLLTSAPDPATSSLMRSPAPRPGTGTGTLTGAPNATIVAQIKTMYAARRPVRQQDQGMPTAVNSSSPAPPANGDLGSAGWLGCPQ